MFEIYTKNEISRYRIKKAFVYLIENGPFAFIEEIKRETKKISGYKLWIEKNETHDFIFKDISALRHQPKISIVSATFNPPGRLLKDMLDSVLSQTYLNWELCIADGGSEECVKNLLGDYAKKDNRIKITFLRENKGISENFNEALTLAAGDYICFLDHDDCLAPFALFEVAKAINENPNVDIIYSDEDKMREDKKIRFAPFFKPDWSPDTLRSYDYIFHLFVIKKELIRKTGFFKKEFDGAQDYDFILRATEKTDNIVHVPKILYHWRTAPASTAKNPDIKFYATERVRMAIGEHLNRTGLKGKVTDGKVRSTYKVTYEIKNNPKVSIIIPNQDHEGNLKKCLSSIIKKSAYKNYEIIIGENNSKEKRTFTYYNELSKAKNIKIIEWNKGFNYSAINNHCVKFSEGGFLLFLNNATEVINSDWLERMLEHAQRKKIGAVGAKLYYPDGSLQHCGVIVGIGGTAGHAFRRFSMSSKGYWNRAKVIQNLSAVTGACLMTKRDVFEKVGGFDEKFTLAFGDIDYCLKLRREGYLIIWTPYAELYHYEKKIRGGDTTTTEKREFFRKEKELLRNKWEDIFDKGDPYYNPNLTLQSEDFSLRV